MTSCPCKNCENKGCGSYHDKCEPYQKYAEEQRKIHEVKHADKIMRDIIWEQINKGIKRKR